MAMKTETIMQNGEKRPVSDSEDNKDENQSKGQSTLQDEMMIGSARTGGY